MLSSLDARVFEELTSPALQILAVAGPVSGREGEGVLVSTGEFFLWPALLSLAATRVDVAQQRDHLHTAVIEAVKEYKASPSPRSSDSCRTPCPSARQPAARCSPRFERRAPPPAVAQQETSPSTVPCSSGSPKWRFCSLIS